VLDPTGAPIGNSDDRTPDNLISVRIHLDDVNPFGPLGWLPGSIVLGSEAEFLIE